MPVVRGVETECVLAKEKANTIDIIVLGNFAYAETVAPQFKLNGKTYLLKASAKDKLTFQIEIDIQALDKCAFLNGTLYVKWKCGYIPYVSWKESAFKMVAKVIPRTIGKISVDLMKIDVIKNKVDHTCKILRQKEIHDLTIKPKAGFKIVKDSPTLIWTQKYNKPSYRLKSVDESQVTFEIDSRKGCGRILITFNEVREVDVIRNVSRQLKCGENWSEKMDSSEKITRIVFEAFYGMTYQFEPKSDISNPFFFN